MSWRFGIREGTTVIGEGMAKVEAVASKIPDSKILNDMPAFTGQAMGNNKPNDGI